MAAHLHLSASRIFAAGVVSCLLNIVVLTHPALAAGVDLMGGGATFPAIMYQTWIERFKEINPGSTIRYDSVGTGEGWARYAAGTIDFAASETPVPPAVVEKFENVIQAPATAGMIAIAYNLPGVASGLRLPRDVLADIFMGKVAKWNDPRIQAANPGARLPERPIVPVVRKDSSGTTYAFTRSLSASVRAWREGPGFGKLISWPATAVQARGNEGVAATIKIKEGSVGYVEFGYSLKAGLSVAALQNRAQNYVAPSTESGLAALGSPAAAELKELMEAILDPVEPNAYPIVSYSLILMRGHYGQASAQTLKAFVTYLLGDGQRLAIQNGYLPLPAHVAAFSRNALEMVNTPHKIAVATAPPARSESAAKDLAASNAAPATPIPQTSRTGEYGLSADALMGRVKLSSYRVSEPESLRDVAVKIYRDPDQWIFIAALNPGVDNRHRLRIGQVLKLP